MFVLTKQTRQLIKQIRIPCAPGQPEIVDYEYERSGVADVFMIFEPLAGKRDTIVTRTRTAIDFANALKHVSDVMYPDAEIIAILNDNLNTHGPAAFYKAFPPEEARRLANRFEWHYTPKHASWRNMEEIESGIMYRQALDKPLPDFESIKRNVQTWTKQRNEQGGKVNWQFTTKDATIKLRCLYPTSL